MKIYSAIADINKISIIHYISYKNQYTPDNKLIVR